MLQEEPYSRLSPYALRVKKPRDPIGSRVQLTVGQALPIADDGFTVRSGGSARLEELMSAHVAMNNGRVAFHGSGPRVDALPLAAHVELGQHRRGHRRDGPQHADVLVRNARGMIGRVDVLVVRPARLPAGAGQCESQLQVDTIERRVRAPDRPCGLAAPNRRPVHGVEHQRTERRGTGLLPRIDHVPGKQRLPAHVILQRGARTLHQFGERPAGLDGEATGYLSG